MLQNKQLLGGETILTSKQQEILNVLQKDPYLTQQEIANQLGLSRPNVANLIMQLVDMGYILGRAYIINDKQDNLVVCIGAANIDYKLSALEPIRFETSNPIKSSLSMGGVIRNVAENCGRLDMNVSLVSLVGQDSGGQSLIDHLNGICSTQRITKIEHATTGSYYAVLNNDGELISGLADMAICEQMNRSWISQHETFLKQASLIVVDTNVKPDCIEYLLEFSETYQKKLVVVGVSSIKMNRLPHHPFHLYCGIFNLDESQSYFNEDSDAQTLANKWTEHGLENVIITQGTRPVIYASANNLESFPIYPAQNIIDVTGAGDSFIAGCLYGLSKQLSFPQCIPYGLTNSYHTIQHEQSVRTNLSPITFEKEKEQLTHE